MRTDAEYLDFEYWGPDEETKNNKLRIVTTRTEHECVTPIGDIHLIPVGSRAICETAIHVDNGRVSCYICLECADEVITFMIGDDL